MGTQREEVIVRGGFDNTVLERGLRTTQGMIKEFAGKAVTAFAGMFGIGTFINFEKQLIQFASHIADTATRLNLTTEAVQRLEYASKMAGGELDTTAMALDKLAVAKQKILSGDAGSDKLLETFQKFGVSFKEIQTLSPDALFTRIADSVAKTGANASVTASAIDLFGKSGGRLIPVLKELRENSENAPIVSDKDIQNIKKAGDQFESFGMKVKAFAASVQMGLINEGGFWKKLWNGLQMANPITEAALVYRMFEQGQTPTKGDPTAAGIPDADSLGGGNADGGGAGGGGGNRANTSDLYYRRAKLMREIGQVGKNSYKDFLKMKADLQSINDVMDLNNAKTPEEKLQVQRRQLARDLGHEQSQLLPENLRDGQRLRIVKLADQMRGLDDRIYDARQPAIQKLAENAAKQTTALEKLEAAATGTGLNVKLASK